MQNYQYKVFGLVIESEVELPELVKNNSTSVDVNIRFGEVPNFLQNPSEVGILFELSPSEFLFKIDNIADYFVTNGDTIRISPKQNSTENEIRLFLLGSTMGALLFQRKMFPLHGSAISKNGKGAIIAGVSSSGKSSLAAGLIKKDFKSVADDISVISFNDENVLQVFPGIPHLKLWKDVLSNLNKGFNYVKVRNELEKYIVPVLPNSQTGPITLQDVIILSTKNTPGFLFEAVRGTQKFKLLQTHTYRRQFVEKMGLANLHFQTLGKIANSINMYKLERPSTPLQIIELAEFVEDKILNY